MGKIFLSVLIGFAFSVLISPLVIKFMRKLKANQTILCSPEPRPLIGDKP